MSFESVIDTLEIRNANKISFVGTSSSFIDTTTGRIQTKGIQHNSNVITDVSGPHGRGVATLKKYPEIAFEDEKVDRNESTDTYAQAGYTVSASSSNAPTYSPIKAFNGIISGNDAWTVSGSPYQDENGGDPGAYNAGTYSTTVLMPTSTSIPGEYIQIKLPHKIKPTKFTVASYSVGQNSLRQPNSGVFAGSNDGTTWYKLVEYSNETTWTHKLFKSFIVTDNIDSTYEYVRFIIRRVGNHNDHSGVTASDGSLSIHGLEVYGYEEDPPAGDHSVDTTFKSRFNNPQLTGVQVLVDGKEGQLGANQISGGPDPSGNSSTYVTDGKYWTLNGTLTSNLSVEANTFLEGDQPHAVSVWFNSSNLEANVSNTCVFSIASEEKLDSVNLDLQSNTWHNLTYAYQGEGGSRVTYLDGRKVAEDQAEDTFGDYPPFDMTGYRQGGYVVSASSEYDTSYRVWEAFNNVWHNNGNTNGSDAWLSENATNYNGSDGLYSKSPPRNLGTGAHDGEWVKIEMPHKFKLNYITIYPRYQHDNKAPRDFIVYGSNDNVNWSPVLTKTGASITSSHVETGHTFSMDVYDTCYKYFGLVIRKLRSNTTFVAITELKFYGHRENDLVRLPDPTNVLKYPHIIINEPAKRGYVVSSSTEAVPPLTTGSYQAYNIFDGELVFDGGTSNTPPNGTAWISVSSKYDGSGNPTGTAASTNVIGQSPVATPGEWFQLELPHKVKLSSIRVMGQTNNTTELAGRSPVDAVLAGSNNGTTWTTVLTYTGASWTTLSEFKSFPANVDSTNAYKYFRFITTKTGGDQYAAIQEFEFYGTGVDSIPIQIGGGNIDKVANFRVYDKFVEEDQALEIWNAQKEEFGRAKPQMVLQQGKLGIGTDAPQGSLSVADEPHAVEEFPPRALSDDKTYIEGHGEFCTNASNIYTSSYAYKAFNKIQSGSGMNLHWSQHDATSVPTYDNTTGDFTGSTDSRYLTNVDGIIVNGHWIQIEFPYKINYRYSEIQGPDHAAGRQPHTGYIVGSNDLSDMWTSLHNYSGMTRTGVRDFVTYTPPTVSTQTFKYIRLVIEKMGGGNEHAGVSQWRIFGTRDGQSVLHDGQLTLTKSLNVPRIGPPLDADDTPRRDQLVVEYNTSTNPTFEGAVRDTSGRGNDGMFYGGASYDASEKALVFNGTTSDQFVHTLKNGRSESGNINYSVSLWFNPTTVNVSRWRAVFAIGVLDRTQPTDNNGDEITLFVRSGSDVLHLQNGGSSVDTTDTVNPGQWVHIVVTYDGTNRKIYLDGSLSVSNGYSALDLPKEMLIRLAQSIPNNGEQDEYMDCKISNFKAWFGAALTAQEVKTLYDMGRCDEGHHVVNFSKTRVGIGLGDGEAPRAALDVREQGILSKAYIGEPYNGDQGKRTADLVIKQSGDVNGGAKTSGIRMFRAANDTNSWHFGVTGGTNFEFSYNNSTMGYLGRTNVNVIDFTGQHRTFIKDIPFSRAGELEGLIVSSDQNKYIKINNGIETGSNAILINESLPVVSLSNTVMDKKCFGVISASEDPEERSDSFGNFVSVTEKEKGDTRVYINSVGEGAIWVVNTNGSLESGDYITTSNVAGYGQKQDSEFLANYTVAKITMDCDFEPVTQPVQRILRSNVVQTYYLGNVHHVKSVPYEIITTEEGESNVVYDTKYTLTTTANVTESDAWDNVFIDPPEVTYIEYSNLEANVQSTYTLTFTQTTTDEKTPTEWSALESNVQSLYNKVYYQSVEEEVVADYPGAVAHTRVTDKIENTLDEYGQIQWEDHPTETEKAYKVRYLTADGTQTDEANAVHIAAFVGCTYHCG